MRPLAGLAVAVAVGVGALAPAAEIEAVVSSADCYALYTGAATGAQIEMIGSNCAPRPMAPPTPIEWAPPAKHHFNVDGSKQVYIVVWGAAPVSPGLLAQFETSGLRLLSGDATWRVTRTYVKREIDDPPLDEGLLGRIIHQANIASAWEEVDSGARNDMAPLRVSEIEAGARWMWAVARDEDIIEHAGSGNGDLCYVFRTRLLQIKPETELFMPVSAGGLPYAIGATPKSHERAAMIGGGGGGASRDLPLGGGFTSVFTPPEMWDWPAPNTPTTEWLDPPTPASSRPTGGGDDLTIIDTGDEPTPPEHTPSDDPPDTPPSVPEPSTAVLLLLGALLGHRVRRR